MLMGLVMLALPITIISENFALEYQRKELMRLDELEKKERMMMEEKKRDRSRRRQKILSVVAIKGQGQDGGIDIFHLHEWLVASIALLLHTELWLNVSQEDLPRPEDEKKHRQIKSSQSRKLRLLRTLWQEHHTLGGKQMRLRVSMAPVMASTEGAALTLG